MTTDTEPVPLLVTMGYPGDGSFNLRFPEHYAQDIQDLFDDHNLSHSAAMEMSAGADLWIETVRVVSLPGGLAALAACIKLFIHRHDNKRFMLERNGEVFQAEGYSEDATIRFLTRLADEQVARDADWEHTLRAHPESERNK